MRERTWGKILSIKRKHGFLETLFAILTVLSILLFLLGFGLFALLDGVLNVSRVPTWIAGVAASGFTGAIYFGLAFALFWVRGWQDRKSARERERREEEERQQRRRIAVAERERREEEERQRIRMAEAERERRQEEDRQQRIRMAEAERERREEEERKQARLREEQEREQERKRLLEEQRRKFFQEAQERKLLRKVQERQRIESLLRRAAVRDEINYMSGLEFKRFMADLFRQQGYGVKQTKATGDQGVDLLLPDVDGKRVAVQLKRHTRPVGNNAVQATFAGMAHYEADEGWIITTSTFTKSARELARSTRVRLIDGKELGEWLEELGDAE